jgi:F-type H+-transporting ATPase subunit delta
MPGEDSAATRSTRIEAYAAALFAVAGSEGEGTLETVEEELFRVARTIEGSDELRDALTDEAIPVDKRQGIVEDLLGERAHPTTTALVSFVVGTGRGRDLPDIIDRLVELATEKRAETVAEVRSSMPLNDDVRRRLGEALSERTGKAVSVKVMIDPSILGGIIAQVGDTIIDGSVRHRLDQLRSTL